MARGRKTGGGSRKGKPNKRTAERVAAAEASGLMPVDYLLSVMRDPEVDRAVRVSVALEVAPYLHAKLAPVGKDGNTAGATIQVIFQGSDVHG